MKTGKIDLAGVNKRDSVTRMFLVASVLVLALWAAAWILEMMLIGAWDDRAHFGDMFGSVNSLFSGLAFAGVIVAILLQKSELSLQREELSLTRKELSRSALAQEESRKALTEQARIQSANARLAALTAILDSKNLALSRNPRAVPPHEVSILESQIKGILAALDAGEDAARERGVREKENTT